MREDVRRALSEYQIKTFGNQKNLERAEKLLKPDEKVLFVTPTNINITHVNTRKHDFLPGIVFLTDKRLLFSFKALSSFSTESIPFNEIRSADCSGNGMTGSQISVHTITKSYSILVTYKRDLAQRIFQLFENTRSSAIDSSPLSSPAPAVSPVDEIRKYKDLLDCGALTQEEFDAKKKQLLNL